MTLRIAAADFCHLLFFIIHLFTEQKQQHSTNPECFFCLKLRSQSWIPTSSTSVTKWNRLCVSLTFSEHFLCMEAITGSRKQVLRLGVKGHRKCSFSPTGSCWEEGQEKSHTRADDDERSAVCAWRFECVFACVCVLYICSITVKHSVNKGQSRMGQTKNSQRIIPLR